MKAPNHDAGPGASIVRFHAGVRARTLVSVTKRNIGAVVHRLFLLPCAGVDLAMR